MKPENQAMNSAQNFNSKWSEDWVPVKNILNGMIQLENGLYVTGVKVASKNIFILDPGERDNILYNLQNFYNMMDYEFWLVVADRPVDINLYLSQLQLLYQKTTDSAIRKLILQDINKANAFMGAEYNVVDTEYFILFKEKSPEMIFDVPKSQFDGADIEVGMQFEASSPAGSHIVTVVEITDESVKVDANHPLAGEKLFFDIKVVEVREATAEELAGDGCGCGCGCGDDDDDYDGGCGGGCSSCGCGCH